MSYVYYPGCSLTGTARDYDQSARAAMAELGVPLEELRDWNCCGASAAPSVDPDLGLALSARNLRLAEERQAGLAVACANCYTNLRRAGVTLQARTPAGDRLRATLAETGQDVAGTVQVRHLLELVVHEIGLDIVRSHVKRPLQGLKVASYYGCQLGRPGGAFADPELPTEMDDLMIALGAQPVGWNGKNKCCGASIMMTHEEAALPLVDMLIGSALGAGAQIISAACSVCQMNLDAYQSRVNADHRRNFHLPVVYFTQLMGLAFGLDPKQLGFNKAFVPALPVLQPYLQGVIA